MQIWKTVNQESFFLLFALYYSILIDIYTYRVVSAGGVIFAYL